MNERDIFLEALEKPTAAERAAFLDTACGDDRALRTRLEALLQSHDSAGEFLGKSAVERVAERMANVEVGAETEGAAAPPPAEERLDFLAPSQMAGSLGRIGHYEVQEVIGRGGMGIVLRALDERLHRVVAIKVMAPQLATSAAARKRFSKEAQAAAAICHDHIVTIHAVDEANGLPYLVMQYVAGVSLQERITRSGSLQLQEILRIGMQTASGLAAAHAQGLIHRDVKPANILLENGVERVKITDFGLARAVSDSSTSQSGLIAGTPQYMSPEQVRGEAIDRRADLFSLGSVLYAMCTGRSPFRGANSIAVLKRVCEESPAPIRESNPEIPAWLAAIVEKLHAKDPAKRYQTAAEVAEVLGRHLAEVQHPSVVLERPAPRTFHSKRWAVAAAILLLLLVGLGMAEGTGVTGLTSTVIRLLTPDGTLVVEMNDPGVKVTVDGDGGLVITGVGQHEVRLKPGIHTLLADKNGKPVPLTQDLVTITRGDKTPVVKVSLEGAAVPLVAAPKGEVGAFVVLDGKGGEVRKFNTLAEAVQSASDGDTIEIRGNGPFVTDPIKITGSGLNILAGEGYRPVIKLSDQGLQSYDPLLETKAALTLEGLEFQRLGQKTWKPGQSQPCIIFARGASLGVANCRFRSDSGAANYQVHIVTNAAVSHIRNCLFLTPGETSVGAWGNTLVLDNCLHLGRLALSTGAWGAGNGGDFRLRRNTLMSPNAQMINFAYFPEANATPRPAEVPNFLKLEATENVFDVSHVLHFGPDTEHAPDPKESESSLVRVVTWKGRDNVYQVPAHFVFWTWPRDRQAQSPHGPRNLEDWRKFWNSPEPGSVEGAVRYQGGDLLARLATAPDKLTPEDFRLRPDSAGYRAGPDGKDPGADVDLVGPGPAYERWKKTPEYQAWLKETRQDKKAELAKVESKAFVLQGGQGVEVCKFDTLAGAVQAASAGDIIEIRGNGPFVSKPINIGKTALTIRAGAGFRPVIKPSPEGVETASFLATEAALVLEGLEIPMFPEDQEKPGRSFQSHKASLRAANCKFHGGIWMTQSPVCEFRNCEFLIGSGPWSCFAQQINSGARILFENCLCRSNGHAIHLFYAIDAIDDVSMQITRSTFMSKNAPLALSLQCPMPAGMDGPKASKPIRLEVSRSVFDSSGIFAFGQQEGFTDKAGVLPPGEADAMLLRLLEWRGERNLFPAGSNSVSWHVNFKAQPPRGPKGLDEWKKFSGSKEADSRDGRPKFHGGSLLARAEFDQPTPEDFRLRPDSDGYRAGPDGKDLGADVDLVGPGPAYERWKKTPEYQTWLKETKQQRAEVPQADDGAAVEEDIKKLSERIEKSPDDRSARIARAHLYTRLRQWRAAADDLGEAGEAVLSDPADAFLYAILLVHLRESTLHRQFCEKMLDRFASTKDVWTANCLVKSCLLQPGIVDPSSLPVSLLSEDREFATKEPQWVLREARALVAYRAGKFDEARRLVRETLALPAYKNDPLYAPRSLSILAMATHKSGDAQLARDLYEQARQQFDKNQLSPGHPATICWAFADVLRREAAQELGLEDISLDGVAARELAKWQGEWENSDHGRLIIKGDRWSWHPKEGPEVVSTIKIVEVTDKMTHVLLLNTGLDAKVRTIQAILQVDGDTLHNCGTIGSIRPTEFAQKAGYLYIQWKRVAKKPP